jgi:CobQ/CobB/MinD/ParA nucleotide binding domain
MSTIHLVGGEKGGVGKSVLARLLAQLFIDRGIPYAAIDADAVHGALARYYPDRTQSIDLASLESADQIMDRALGSERRVLVDLPAQSARPLQRWLEAGDVLAYARDMNVAVVLWHVTDGGYDSVAELARVVAAFGGRLRLVVVRNWGRSGDFSQLDGSPTLETTRALGGQVVDLPALDAATMYKIDQSGLSFWAASNATDGVLSAMERRRAQLWLERCYQALDGAGDWN